jgi:hypothetical protein
MNHQKKLDESPATAAPDQPIRNGAGDITAPPSWRTLAEIFADVIGKAEGLPRDLAAQHDHYLHGRAKQ